MFLMIDNEDSFTYNIVNAFFLLGIKLKVIGNQDYDFWAKNKNKIKGIVLGPGPGSPKINDFFREIFFFQNVL